MRPSPAGRLRGVAIALVLAFGPGARPSCAAPAERAGSQALQSIPAAARPHVERAVARYTAGDLDGATHALQSAASVAPREAQVRFMLGNAYFRTGRFGRATTEYRTAARLRPGHADTHLDLGFALFHSGLSHQAVEAWREAVRLEPVDALARLALAVGLAASGDEARSVEAYRAALELDATCTSPEAIARDVRWREAGAAQVARLSRLDSEARR